MKKIVLSIVFVLFFASVSFAADYYSVGVDAFKKGAYDKACSNLSHAIRINPKNVDARYYLAQVYLKQNQTAEAVAQYNRIILLAPDSSAARLSQKGLSLVKMAYANSSSSVSIQELEQYKDNYFDYVLTNSGDISKWKAFPLIVYIEPKRQKNAAKIAFEQWEAKSKKLVSFKFVDVPEKAQISVVFKDKLESTSTAEKFFAGFSRPTYEGRYLSKSEINILTVNPQTNADFDDNFISATTLHELGHSLGISGHSPNENDVMAASTANPKIELTKRDINTLNIVYKMDSKMLAQRKTGGGDFKLKQAQEYIKTSPEKYIGWSNLGDIYFSKKMYSSAINNYKKAISIEPDRAGVYSSLGVSYRLSGDKQNAYQSFKKAYELESSNATYKAQYFQICKELGRKTE